MFLQRLITQRAPNLIAASRLDSAFPALPGFAALRSIVISVHTSDADIVLQTPASSVIYVHLHELAAVVHEGRGDPSSSASPGEMSLTLAARTGAQQLPALLDPLHGSGRRLGLAGASLRGWRSGRLRQGPRLEQ